MFIQLQAADNCSPSQYVALILWKPKFYMKPRNIFAGKTKRRVDIIPTKTFSFTYMHPHSFQLITDPH
jgi:hypothetical protein